MLSNFVAVYKKSHVSLIRVGLFSLIIQNGPVLAEIPWSATHNYEKVQLTKTLSASMGLEKTINTSTALDLIPESTNSTVQNTIAASPVETSIDQVTLSKSMNSITSVSQLSNVLPTDWFFQAFQSLVKRYDCLEGYPDGILRGSRAHTRYEFAAKMNTCFNKINERVGSLSLVNLIVIQRLQNQFRAELAILQSQVKELEEHTAKLEANQVSITTKFAGQAIFAVTGGNFSGEHIVSPTGTEIKSKKPSSTFIYKVSLDLNTSFSRTDLLKIRLSTGSDRGDDNTAGLLEPTFGSVLDFSAKPSNDGQLGLSRLYYTFTPFQNFTVSLGPTITATDYVDRNSYANLSFLDFSTQALINNPILFPINGLGSGAAVDWNPGKGALTLRAVYVAGDAANAKFQGVIRSVSPFTRLLYPSEGGKRGLFSDPYQGAIELEYSPSRNFALRLQYGGGHVLDGRFDVFGVNFELAFSQQLAVFGRYGYGSYENTAFGEINPSYWMAGVALRDLFVLSALAGLATSQPFVESAIGNATQTNIEAFYNFPLRDNIRITPLIQVIFNPANQSSNGTIVTGTLRTVFSF